VERLKQAMARCGYERPHHLTQALGRTAAEVPRYLSGERQPGGWNLVAIAWQLGASPFWLYGLDGNADARSHLAEILQVAVGSEEAEMVRLLGRLTPERRALVMERVRGIVEGLTMPGGNDDEEKVKESEEEGAREEGEEQDSEPEFPLDHDRKRRRRESSKPQSRRRRR
jgi:hypothetical protein